MSLIKQQLVEAINRHARNSLKVVLEQMMPGLTVNIASITSSVERGDSESNLLFTITISGHTVPKDVIPSPSPES
jgi:hypothetical protein